MNLKKPRILLIDIETSPIVSYTWGLWKQNVSLSQIKDDWSILSFAAKWQNEDKMFYYDVRNNKNIKDDKKLLKEVWKLLDEADIVCAQNGDRFDIPKLNARFIINNFIPPSGYKTIDTLKLARKNFSFTSNKLEHLAKTLNLPHKKSQHKKFPGFELWKECLKGNKEAWKEMESYNKEDVLTLEALLNKLQPWDKSTTINYSVYTDELVNVCKCGSTQFKKCGFHYTPKGKFQRYRCSKCFSEAYSTGKSNNLLSKEKQKLLNKR